MRDLQLLAAIAAVLFALCGAAVAECDTTKPSCRGCGCKGGPGYREIATQRCVGFRNIDKLCGNPPNSALCTFENAPGTGENKECALESRKRRTKKEENGPQ